MSEMGKATEGVWRLVFELENLEQDDLLDRFLDENRGPVNKLRQLLDNRIVELNGLPYTSTSTDQT